MIATDVLNNLPDKIRNNLPIEVTSGCIAVIKTAYKPNPNTPTLWLIMYQGGFVCCSTNKSNCVYKKMTADEIDSIRVVKGAHAQFSLSQIEFIFKALSLDDFKVPVPHDTDFDKIVPIFKGNGYQVI